MSHSQATNLFPRGRAGGVHAQWAGQVVWALSAATLRSTVYFAGSRGEMAKDDLQPQQRGWGQSPPPVDPVNIGGLLQLLVFLHPAGTSCVISVTLPFHLNVSQSSWRLGEYGHCVCFHLLRP